VALTLDRSSAKIAWKTAGATAAVHIGAESVLLHCTKNVTLAAADVSGVRATHGPAVEIEGRVFLEATAGEFDIGNFQFGMVQVSTLHAYDVLYVGRVPSEGSTAVDLRRSFANPSLDVEPDTGETIQGHVFSPNNLIVDRVGVPRPDGKKGFDVKVSFTDNPWSLFNLQFENRRAAAPNFIARAARNEAFITYFIVREPDTSITILAWLGWTVNWFAEFNWTGGRPALSASRSLLFPGESRIGAPAADAESTVAVRLNSRTTNQMDNDANDAWKQRREPDCMQLRERPPGFRSNFYQ